MKHPLLSVKLALGVALPGREYCLSRGKKQRKKKKLYKYQEASTRGGTVNRVETLSWTHFTIALAYIEQELFCLTILSRTKSRIQSNLAELWGEYSHRKNFFSFVNLLCQSWDASITRHLQCCHFHIFCVLQWEIYFTLEHGVPNSLTHTYTLDTPLNHNFVRWYVTYMPCTPIFSSLFCFCIIYFT